MKFKEYTNQKTVLFMSGMFAGSWIWKDCHKNIPAAKQLFIENALCEIGKSVDEISANVIDSLHAIDSKVVIVGNSLGGYIGLEIAKQRPDLVEKVIISGSAGFSQVKLPLKIDRKNVVPFAKQILELICFDETKAREDAYTAIARNFENHFKNILYLSRENNAADATKLISQVKCPIEAIWGENDIVTPLSDAKPILDRFAIPTVVIKNCGHSPMFELPWEFSASVDLWDSPAQLAS